MDKEFKLLGYWRDSANPEKTLQGNLKFIPNKGGYLELIGSFKNLKREDLDSGRDMKEIMRDIEEDPKYQDKQNIDVILGFTVDGKEVTLRNCVESNFQLTISHNELVIRTEYWVQMVVVGAWFTSEIKLRDMSVVFSHVDEWLTIFKIGRHASFSKKEVYVAATSEDSRSFPINSDLKIALEIPTKVDELRNFRASLKKIAIEQYPLFIIQFSQEKTLDDYHQIMIRFRNLLSLILCQPINILSIKCTSEAIKVIEKTVVHYPEIEIYFSFAVKQDFDSRPKNAEDFLIQYDKISPQLTDILKSWFSGYAKFEPIYDIFFDSFFNKQTYLYHTFLTMIQAIESLHRRLYPSKTMLSSEEFEEVKKEVFKLSLSSEAVDLLKTRLKYANELTLRKRLKDTIEGHNHFVNLFKDNREISEFIDKIVNTRNYLTHYDDSLRTQSAKEDELHEITDKLTMILYFLILQILGFNPEYLERVFKRHWKYEKLFTHEP